MTKMSPLRTEGKLTMSEKATVTRHVHYSYQAPVGSGHHAARLTEADVVRMRERYAEGEPQRALATDYGLSVGHVCKIVNGIRWRHVGGPIASPGRGRRRKRAEV